MNQTITYVDSDFDANSLWTLNDADFEVLVIGTFSTFSSILNIIVFSHPSLKDPAFKILMLVSLADLFYMTLAIFVEVFIKCEQSPILCGELVQYQAFVADIAVENYLTSCLAIFSIMTEVYLTAHRLLLIKNVNFIKNLTVKTVGPVLGILALIYYLPTLFVTKVEKTGNMYVYRNQTFVEYSNLPTEFGSSLTGQWMIASLEIIRIFLVFCVLFPLNLVSIVVFQKYFNKKRKLTVLAGASNNLVQRTPSMTGVTINAANVQPGSNLRATIGSNSELSRANEANRNVTLMLISVSFLYVIGTLPYMIVEIIVLTNASVSDEFLSNLIIIAYFALFTFPGLKFCVFYLFNRLFRQQVRNYWKSMKAFFMKDTEMNA